MLFCRTAGTVRRFLHTPRALVYARYGAPQEELTLKEIPEADLALKSDDDVLVKVFFFFFFFFFCKHVLTMSTVPCCAHQSRRHQSDPGRVSGQAQSASSRW